MEVVEGLQTRNKTRRGKPLRSGPTSLLTEDKLEMYREFILSIYKFSLSVCLYPINVKATEPIEPKFFVGTRVTPGKVYG